MQSLGDSFLTFQIKNKTNQTNKNSADFFFFFQHNCLACFNFQPGEKSTAHMIHVVLFKASISNHLSEGLRHGPNWQSGS